MTMTDTGQPPLSDENQVAHAPFLSAHSGLGPEILRGLTRGSAEVGPHEGSGQGGLVEPWQVSQAGEGEVGARRAREAAGRPGQVPVVAARSANRELTR
jgi:hypothetical protein